jgi:hypothetical protein
MPACHHWLRHEYAKKTWLRNHYRKERDKLGRFTGLEFVRFCKVIRRKSSFLAIRRASSMTWIDAIIQHFYFLFPCSSSFFSRSCLIYWHLCSRRSNGSNGSMAQYISIVDILVMFYLRKNESSYKLIYRVTLWWLQQWYNHPRKEHHYNLIFISNVQFNFHRNIYDYCLHNQFYLHSLNLTFVLSSSSSFISLFIFIFHLLFFFFPRILSQLITQIFIESHIHI